MDDKLKTIIPFIGYCLFNIKLSLLSNNNFTRGLIGIRGDQRFDALIIGIDINLWRRPNELTSHFLAFSVAGRKLNSEESEPTQTAHQALHCSRTDSTIAAEPWITPKSSTAKNETDIIHRKMQWKSDIMTLLRWVIWDFDKLMDIRLYQKIIICTTKEFVNLVSDFRCTEQRGWQ